MSGSRWDGSTGRRCWTDRDTGVGSGGRGCRLWGQVAWVGDGIDGEHVSALGRRRRYQRDEDAVAAERLRRSEVLPRHRFGLEERVAPGHVDEWLRDLLGG